MSGVAFIAGGSAGIGLAAARRLGAEGFRVVVAGRSRERRDAAVAALVEAGVEAACVELDILDDDSCAAAVADAESALGPIDVLVNSVGSAPAGTVDVIERDAWRSALDGKVIGSARLMALVIPGMRERHHGRIVNVSGTAGVEPDPWMPVAGAANAALLAITKAASLQLAGDGITVNAVLPGPTRTSRWDGLVTAHAARTGLDPDAARRELEARVPTGRPAEPDDIAAYIAFLASASAAHITGTGLAVDGGQNRSI